MITVLLADGHCLIRAGLRHYLETAQDIRILAEARSGEDSLELACRHKPRVVVIGATIHGMGGLEFTRRLTQKLPKVRVISLVLQTQGPYVNHMLAAGAVGCLSKEYMSTNLPQAVRHVASGKRYISPDIAGSLADVLAGDAPASPFDSLSVREMEVMEMLLQGNGTKKIAACLNLSPQTVSTYRQRLYVKLDVRNDVELLRLALRFGMIEEYRSPQA
jgi:two-component system invasion response regulator UvrY